MTALPIDPPGPSERSWWLEEALRAEGGAPSARPLAGSVECDIAIVGGGFTGLWAALALRERAPQARVALIEASICGAGASGKNGGKAHGYWSMLPSVVQTLGDEGGLAIARAGSKAQAGLRAFGAACGRDIWWREAGAMKVSAAPAQDAKLAAYVAEAQRLGVPDAARALSPAEVQEICRSPAFRGGVLFSEGASVHPARLVRALREAAIRQGVRVFENTPMVGIDAGGTNRIRTAQGELLAREVILATNTGVAAFPGIRDHVSVFSSYALMTTADPELLRAVWPSDIAFSDCRMFVHYFRKTPDGRVLMGSGSGPISYGGRDSVPTMRFDRPAAARAIAGLRRLLPGLAGMAVEQVWGGALDVSADRLPFFGTLPGTRIHYGCGYSGHGVTPSYIGGQTLASLATGTRDEWTALPFCTRRVPGLPPEPFRYVGGAAIRWGILSCEVAEEQGRSAYLPARAMAALPKALGLRIGVR